MPRPQHHNVPVLLIPHVTCSPTDTDAMSPIEQLAYLVCAAGDTQVVPGDVS